MDAKNAYFYSLVYFRIIIPALIIIAFFVFEGSLEGIKNQPGWMLALFYALLVFVGVFQISKQKPKSLAEAKELLWSQKVASLRRQTSEFHFQITEELRNRSKIGFYIAIIFSVIASLIFLFAITSDNPTRHWSIFILIVPIFTLIGLARTRKLMLTRNLSFFESWTTLLHEDSERKFHNKELLEFESLVKKSKFKLLLPFFICLSYLLVSQIFDLTFLNPNRILIFPKQGTIGGIYSIILFFIFFTPEKLFRLFYAKELLREVKKEINFGKQK